ncbi:MAG: hypothetical protein V5A39_15040, partial [Haloarculaceae archaeon]
IENLPRDVAGSEALPSVRSERFLVYLMGPCRTFDVEALLPDDAAVETGLPSFVTWDDTAGEYAEDEVLGLLRETRDRLLRVPVRCSRNGYGARFWCVGSLPVV